MEPYPELHARMQADKGRSTTQAARLDDLLARHGTSKSLAKEAVTGTVATVAGFIHAAASEEVLKDVLAAVGFKAYEIGSYKVLVTLAQAAGATEDVATLELSIRKSRRWANGPAAICPCSSTLTSAASVIEPRARTSAAR